MRKVTTKSHRKSVSQKQPFVNTVMCQWFALCNRPATGTTRHPALGNVPTCDRCHNFATGESR